MKEFFISDCTQQENKVITSTFVVITKQVKPKKTGDPYLALTVGDRTGQLEAKMWDNVEDSMDGFDQDDVVKIKGLINKYKNRFQLTIHKIRRMQETEIQFDDYLPKTNKNIDELWETLAGYVAAFEDRASSRVWCSPSWTTPKLRDRIEWRRPPRRCTMRTSAGCSIT